MVTGVVTTNMNPNVLGAAAAAVAVPTQLKETPLKSDRRVSVKANKKNGLKRTAQAATTWIKRLKKPTKIKTDGTEP